MESLSTLAIQLIIGEDKSLYTKLQQLSKTMVRNTTKAIPNWIAKHRFLGYHDGIVLPETIKFSRHNKLHGYFNYKDLYYLIIDSKIIRSVTIGVETKAMKVSTLSTDSDLPRKEIEWKSFTQHNEFSNPNSKMTLNSIQIHADKVSIVFDDILRCKIQCNYICGVSFIEYQTTPYTLIISSNTDINALVLNYNKRSLIYEIADSPGIMDTLMWILTNWEITNPIIQTLISSRITEICAMFNCEFRVAEKISEDAEYDAYDEYYEKVTPTYFS